MGSLGRLAHAALNWTDHRLPQRRWLIVVVTVALALVTTAAASMLTIRTVAAARTEQSSAQALAAAPDLIPKLLNFDHRSIDADLARSRSVSTGDLAAQNDKLAQVLKPTVLQDQASTQTVVRGAGIIGAEPERVVVLAFLNQTTSGTSLPAPQLGSRTARMTLAKVHGSWLLAGFEPI